MGEPERFIFKHKEVVEMMIKAQDLHEGIWGLFVRFGLGATNAGPNDSEVFPAAIVPIVEIGLQRFEKETNISADAAKVNPKTIDSK